MPMVITGGIAMDGMVRDGSWLHTTGTDGDDAGGRRRRWSAASKAAIVAESFTAGAKVSEVAARHGLQANLLSTWRRLAMPAEQRGRVRRAVEPPAVTMDFVPVTVSPEVGGTAGSQADTRSAQDMRSPSVPAPSLIEIMLADASIRVAPGVDTATLSRVLAAVRRGGR
jgi:transposase